MKLSQKLPAGPWLIVVAAVLWAIDGIIRRNLFTLPPIIIVFAEHLIGLIILLPFAFKIFSKEKPTLTTIGHLLLIALCSGVLGTLFFTTALQQVNFISFSVVFLLQKLQPIFAIAAAAIFLKEKINRNYAVWALLALASAFFVTFPNGFVNFATGDKTIMAAFFAFLAAMFWGTSTVFSKMVLQKHSSLFTSFYRFIFTTILAFLGILFLGHTQVLFQVTSFQLSQFILIALSSGMVALLIYYRGLKKTEAKISTLLEMTFPMLAIVIDMVVYQSYLIPSQYIAGLVLMLCFYKLSQLNYSEEIH